MRPSIKFWQHSPQNVPDASRLASRSPTTMESLLKTLLDLKRYAIKLPESPFIGMGLKSSVA